MNKKNEKYLQMELLATQFRFEIGIYEFNYKNSPIDFDKLYRKYGKVFEENDLDIQTAQYAVQAFKYRFLASYLMSIIATWEQQLFKFANQLFNCSDNWYNKFKKNIMNNLKVTEENFTPIEEYRKLDNVLKHGKKHVVSYKELKEMNSVFLLKNDEFDCLTGALFSLPLLNIHDTTVFDLCDKISKFWDNISKRCKNVNCK